MYILPYDDPMCLWRPISPNMLRRCPWHDYRSKCIYMITLKSNRIYGVLSNIVGSLSNPVSPPVAECTPVGMAIAREFANIRDICPDLKITNRVFMPDHIHFLLYATCALKETISFYMSKLMGRCSRAVWNLLDLSSDTQHESVFQPGFNDKILLRKGQLDNFIHYINDNPRRLLVTRENPQYFHNTRKVIIDDTVHDAYGNLDLICHPVRTWVVVRSHYTETELEQYYRHWREIARQGGVLAGPFVSAAEKKIKWGALKAGAKVIEIKQQGFPERYKPGEYELPYCASGQLLQIGYKDYSTRKQSFDRALCLAMNEFAKTIASLSPSQIRYQ